MHKPWLTAAALVAVCLVKGRAEAAPLEGAKVAQNEEPSADEPKRDEPSPAGTDDGSPHKPAATPGEGGDALGMSAPPGGEPAAGDKVDIHPYLLVSGGMKYDAVKGRPEEDKQNRVATFALGRIGLKARWTDLVYAESEFMASGGVGLHGTSVYEGQAAMQVRQQLIRVGRGIWRVEAGRIIDEASLDYFSAHTADTFIQDTATRDPLLFSGFNMGNGVRGTLEITKGLRAGLTFNAGNPVSTTGTLMVGGSFPPFERFYTQPYQQVNQVPNHFPDDTFHLMLLTPSILVDTKYVDAKAAIQGFDIDVDMNRGSNDHIRGYNLRSNVRVKLLDGKIVPYANGAYTRNDTLVVADLSKRAKDRYHAINLGGGVDFNWARRFKCPHDCADGVGLQYQQVQFQIGDGIVTSNRYANLATTYWLAPNLSLGARLAFWQSEPAGAAATGERSAIVSLRFIMP